MIPTKMKNRKRLPLKSPLKRRTRKKKRTSLKTFLFRPSLKAKAMMKRRNLTKWIAKYQILSELHYFNSNNTNNIKVDSPR